MGKTAKCGDGLFYKDLVKQIRCGETIQDISTRDLAKMIGIPESTLYSRLKRPESFRLDELLSISRALCIEVNFRCKLT